VKPDSAWGWAGSMSLPYFVVSVGFDLTISKFHLRLVC
jgi:hypothetical protein